MSQYISVSQHFFPCKELQNIALIWYPEETLSEWKQEDTWLHLPPRSRWYLRSSAILRSALW